MNKGLLLVVSGPAGTGKGTVLATLMEKDSSCIYSVSATTRAPRPGEKDGVNYFFISHEQFEKNIADGAMLEYAQYVGNYYGTPKKFVLDALEAGKNVILEIETKGAMQVKNLMPDAVLVFICPPSRTVLEARLRGRATEDDATIRKRLAEAEREVALAVDYDYVVVNEDGGAGVAADAIRNIILAEKCKRSKCSVVNTFFEK